MRIDISGPEACEPDAPATRRPGRQARIEAALARADPEFRLALLRALLSFDLEASALTGGPGGSSTGRGGEADSSRAGSAGFEEEETRDLSGHGPGDEATGPGPEVPRGAGRFTRVSRHAAGGLGVVYVATDADFGRRVALKEIRPERADDPVSRDRFDREARITSRLEHPGIISVYGGGRYDDGRPYYAMRLVEGPTFEEAIQDYHRARATGAAGGDGLALRGLLRHFVDVCNAVAFAHSRGVIHRDIKPGNVKLGPFGETILLDWGLAKATGDGERGGAVVRPAGPGGGYPTLDGEVRGTPAYMAPEQAAGDVARIGPAADVYGLGATLFYLLNGRPPGPARRGVVPASRAGVPAAPAAICRKAMAFDPEGRYESAQALAGDVERWLADEPVSTHRESRLARLGRWGRKHQPAVAGAVALLATAAVALGVGGWMVGRERDNVVKQEAATARALRAAVDFGQSGTGVITEFLRVVREQLVYLNDPKTEAVRLKLSGIAARYVQAFDEHPIQGHRVRLLLGDALREASRVHLQAHNIGRAEGLLRAAIRSLAALAQGGEVSPDVLERLAEYQIELGGIAYLRDRPEDGEAAYSEALEYCRRAVEAGVDRPEIRRARANALTCLAGVDLELGDAGRSIRRFDEGIGLLEGLIGSGYPGPYDGLLYVNSLQGLAGTLRQGGQFAAAEERLGAAQQALDRMSADDPANIDLRSLQAGLWGERSQLLAAQPGDLDVPIRLAGSAIEAWERLVKDRPGLVTFRASLAVALDERGALHARSPGAASQARADFAAAVAALDSILEAAPQSIRNYGERARAHCGLARLDLEAGLHQSAGEELDRAGRDLEVALQANPTSPQHRATRLDLERLRERAARP